MFGSVDYHTNWIAYIADVVKDLDVLKHPFYGLWVSISRWTMEQINTFRQEGETETDQTLCPIFYSSSSLTNTIIHPNCNLYTSFNRSMISPTSLGGSHA